MRKWIYINGEKTKYKISSKGYVVSTAYKGKKGKVRKLKHNDDSDGYSIITLNHKGKKYTRKIHRLVAEAFIPNPFNYPEVNHKNGDKHDNDYKNLEWVTNIENIHHALETGLRYSLNSEECIHDVCAYLEENKKSIPEISSITGVSKSSVRKILYGVNWKSISDQYDISKYNQTGYIKGKDNKSSKITEKQAKKVCKLLQDGKTPTEVSIKLNIPRSIIYRIKDHKTWKDISKRYNF